ISSMSVAALGPLIFVLLMGFVLNNAIGEYEEAMVMTITGADYAPSLVNYLKRENTELTLSELEDAENAVRDGKEALVLRVPKNYAERFSKGQSVTLDLVYDSSDFGPTQRHFRRARSMIETYAATLGQLRLSLRGIDPVVIAPLAVQEVDVSSPAARALTLLSTIPYLLVLAVFMGGFYLAIDTTAGERENHSLEPLLAQPVSRASLVLGKLGATALFGMLVLIVFLTVFALTVPLVPFHKVGMSVDFGFSQALTIFGLSLPLIFLAAGLLTLVASYAKSYKEAQTYLSVLIFLPTLPIIITQFMDLPLTWWLMLIPSQSQATLINLVISGEPLLPGYIMLSAITTILTGALFAYLAIRLYERERILG
ncbi:MAG: ABC transporter permease, partial [Pseudomonadales bacterium]